MTENTLTPKQEDFAWHYASVDSDTYNFKAKSAEAAKYKAAAQAATKLLANPAVQARIKQIQDANASKNIGRLLSHAEYVYKDSIKNNDRTNANTSIKLQMQACGFLREGVLLTKDEKPPEKLTLEEQKILREAGQKITLARLNKNRERSFDSYEVNDDTEAELVEAEY